MNNLCVDLKLNDCIFVDCKLNDCISVDTVLAVVRFAPTDPTGCEISPYNFGASDVPNQHGTHGKINKWVIKQ